MTAAQSLLIYCWQREELPLRNTPEICSPIEKCKIGISVKMLQSGWPTCTNVLLKDLLLGLYEKPNSLCQCNQDQSRATSTDWSNVTVWQASAVASSVLLICPLEGEEPSINLYASQVSMRRLCICSQEGADKFDEHFWISTDNPCIVIAGTSQSSMQDVLMIRYKTSTSSCELSVKIIKIQGSLLKHPAVSPFFKKCNYQCKQRDETNGVNE